MEKNQSIELLKVTASPDGRLGVDGASIYLQIQPKTMAMWRCAGDKGPKFKKIGGKVNYFISDLDDFIQRGNAVWTD